MSDLSELLRDTAAPAGPPPSVESLRRRTRRRRRSRRIALAAGAAAVLVGGVVVATVTVPDDEGLVTTDTGPSPTTTPAPSTTLAASTTAVASTTTRPTTTRPTTTSTAAADGAVTPVSPVRVEIRVVGPYGVPFPKGGTFANACPDNGGECVIGGVLVDDVGGVALELDPSITYSVTAAASHTDWATARSELFSFSPTYVATGADLAGTVFVVDERPGREPQPTAPDPSSLDPSDAGVQRICATVGQAVIGLAGLAGTAAPALTGSLSDVATDLGAARGAAPGGLQTDLQSLAATVDALATVVGELDAARATAGDAADVIDAVVAAIPSYLRTVASREGLAGSQPGLALACDLRSNGETALDDMITFSDALNTFLVTGLAAEPRFDLLRALADVTDHARRGHDPMSTFVTAFAECSGDPDVTVRGDNTACDRLYDACLAGDLLACNDLYYSAPFQSGYEVFAFFCGNRLTVADQSIAVGGHCELIDG